MKTIPVSILLAGILTPALCFAETPNLSKEQKSGRKPLMEAWTAADTDQDHFISKPEYSAMPRIQNLPVEIRESLFTRLDKDSDGKLSVPELGEFGKPHAGQGDKPMKRLWELDADKSGGVSLDEFKTGQFMAKLPAEKQEGVFRRLDTDGDGSITLKDQPEPPFKHLDGKKTGGGEIRSASIDTEPAPVEQVIHKLDTDGDKVLTFAEFRLGSSMKNLGEDEQEQRFEKVDANNDLKISTEELSASRARPESSTKRSNP
jgi:Ca2+-binding EF-hand superfamily protein